MGLFGWVLDVLTRFELGHFRNLPGPVWLRLPGVAHRPTHSLVFAQIGLEPASISSLNTQSVAQ